MRAGRDTDLAGHVVARGAAATPGTCGELAQGLLDDRLLMVTCPVDLFATAAVELSHGMGRVVAPPGSPKTARAVRLSLSYLGRGDLDARVGIESPFPRGKGMASSTADIVAAVNAVAAALGARLSAREQADLALGVEPSDGVMIPGVALFDHRHGQIAESLGQPPRMRVLILEFAGTVHTQPFNSVDRRKLIEPQAARFREAVELIRAGLKGGDPQLIGRGASLSTVAHQSVLPKPQLPGVLALGRDAGASGVNAAHSGTVLGLLFPDDAERVSWARRRAWKRVPHLVSIRERRLIGGGVIVRRDAVWLAAAGT